jgi:hypothetical protein
MTKEIFVLTKDKDRYYGGWIDYRPWFTKSIENAIQYKTYEEAIQPLKEVNNLKETFFPKGFYQVEKFTVVETSQFD